MAATILPTAAGAQFLRPVVGLPSPDTRLPALEPVKSRDQYRARLEAETEEVWGHFSFRALPVDVLIVLGVSDMNKTLMAR